MKLSAAVLTWNEEKYIGRCLRSLTGICDDIIVVDSDSTDNTRTIALDLGARVHIHPYANTRDSRNLGLSFCRNDWRLIIDADELLDSRCTPDALDSFIRSLDHEGYDAAELPRWNLVEHQGREFLVGGRAEKVVHLVRRGVTHGGHPLHADRAANARKIYRQTDTTAENVWGVFHQKTGLEWMQAARMYWWMCPYTFTQEVPGIPGMIMPPPGSQDLQVPADHWERRETIDVWNEYVNTPAYKKLTEDDIKDLVVDINGWHRRTP